MFSNLNKHVYLNNRLLDHTIRNTYNRYLHSTTRLFSNHAQSNGGPQQQQQQQHRVPRERLRNVGIVAHINAGKTTTTERILYHAGSTESVGDVDSGNTVTDYLIQERDRGITITSAAVSFDWKKHRVNLIDTPGHVDFTIEVERSLSVLDGAVTIIDASAGVEAQTITVWNQATKYKLPNIIFLNKYDKVQADYKMCMKDLKLALEIEAQLIQLPVVTNKGFCSIVDIINRKRLNWINPGQDNGSKFETLNALEDSSLQLDKKYLESIEKEREKLINLLTDLDDTLASHVLECDKITDVSGEHLTGALRRATLDCRLCPVLIGSSFKYIGVQQLMDAIIQYLPSPIDREKQINESLTPKDSAAADGQHKRSLVDANCAFIFKIMHDKRLGALNYIRVCEGTIARQQRVKTLKSDRLDQVKKVYRAFADELREIDYPVVKDDIVVVTGLLESRTGDIIVNQSFNLDHHSKGAIDGEVNGEQVDGATTLPFQMINQSIVVPRITNMEPVYLCSIESLNSSQQIKLEGALACLSREDPSFSYDINEMGITTVRGMGKLHLEIIRDRIQSEYGIEPLLGPLQISYRETIEGSATEELSVSRLINSVKNTLTLKLYVRPKPKAGSWSPKMLRLDTSGEGNSLNRLRQDHRRAIEMGLVSGLAHGPILGFPVIDCDILLLEFQSNRRCGLPVISSAASQCVQAAILRCSPLLLEPIMSLEVVVPSEHNSTILSDISNRRGLVLNTVARNNGSLVIRSRTPLATLADYSEFLRIATSGRGSFSMELCSYTAVGEGDRQGIVRQ